MARHTLGPWLTRKHQKTGRITIYVRIPGSREMVVGQTDPYEMGRGLTEEEHAANARVMAAGPDMLEALKGCVSVMENDLPDAVGHIPPALQPEIRQAKAAINKARGT
jgi:hypothetical protein